MSNGIHHSGIKVAEIACNEQINIILIALISYNNAIVIVFMLLNRVIGCMVRVVCYSLVVSIFIIYINLHSTPLTNITIFQPILLIIYFHSF